MTSNTRDEQQLIEAARQGDSKAFEALLRPYLHKMKQMLHGYFKHSGESEDALQEVQLRVWRGLPKFRGDSKFSTWIYTVTANTARNELAKHKRHRYTDIDACAAEVEAIQAPDILEAGEDARRELAELSELLEQLPGPMAQAFIMRELRGKSHAELAAEWQCAESTARCRTTKARRALRELRELRRLGQAPDTPD